MTTLITPDDLETSVIVIEVWDEEYDTAQVVYDGDGGTPTTTNWDAVADGGTPTTTVYDDIIDGGTP